MPRAAESGSTTRRHAANVTRYLVNATNSSTAQLISKVHPNSGHSSGFLSIYAIPTEDLHFQQA